MCREIISLELSNPDFRFIGLLKIVTLCLKLRHFFLWYLIWPISDTLYKLLKNVYRFSEGIKKKLGRKNMISRDRLMYTLQRSWCMKQGQRGL